MVLAEVGIIDRPIVREGIAFWGAGSARGGVFVEEPAPTVQRAQRGDIPRRIVSVEPVPIERFWKMNESARTVEPDDQIDVLPNRKCRIVAAHGIETGLAEKRARCGGVVSAPQQLRDAALLFHRGIVFKNLVPFIDLVPVAVHEGCLRSALEDAERRFQEGGLPQIVLIETCGMACTNAPVPSVEASSTMMISEAARVCARTESMASFRYLEVPL